MSETVHSDVLVIGGGMAGLAAAYALRQNGATVVLLERASEFGEVGAGLQLAPNATRLLEHWGMLDEVLAVGVRPKNVIFRDALSGDVLLKHEVQGEFAETYGSPYVVVHRSDLHRVLLDGCRRVGVELINSVEIDSVITLDGLATASATDGRIFTAPAVIGADGLKSRLRGQIVDDEPVGSAYVAYRGTVPVSELPGGQKLEDVSVFMGPNCHMVQYPLRGGELLNTVAVFRSSTFENGKEQAPGLAELEEAYKDCVPHMRESLKHLWHGIRWPMYDREPTANWVDGRLILIGDAAHPMLQYLAQGACQALEDAAALEELSRGTVFTETGINPDAWNDVFRDVNEVRAARTARIQSTARVWGDTWHVEGAGREIRNALFVAAGSNVYEKTDWLYGYSPSVVASPTELQEAS
ncbi:3-hydroxybenzoate 6-hydroxylase [Subtercola boreus]|uniref:3-hydroxybenzoate 6-hydroxylase n=1 Tax=Subtercola boreus TaxID=120213 RepID=A0A3E0VPT9_9MICO|nr:FAD-dependent oxidoreductase [Subtercola boreus]RFA10877.1 3-hydroxybenzoate 6-hydroxylase [Subtercola boreus]TQL55540.1 salicylate hydroxylase [Subtercola boreus]